MNEETHKKLMELEGDIQIKGDEVFRIRLQDFDNSMNSGATRVKLLVMLYVVDSSYRLFQFIESHVVRAFKKGYGVESIDLSAKLKDPERGFEIDNTRKNKAVITFKKFK